MTIIEQNWGIDVLLDGIGTGQVPTQAELGVEISLGQPGPAGPPGPSGGTYTHRQATLAATWTVVHNLNSKPIMAIFLDSDLTERVETTATYIDLNTVALEFPSAETGWAYAR